MLNKEQLLKAIEGEQNAIAGYEHMKTMTNDEDHIETLNEIIMDEHKHLRDFEELYRRKFGRGFESPRTTATVGHIFTDSIRRAVGEELDTAEFYWEFKNIPQFDEAMHDETDHAIRLNAMYTREIEKRVM
jgi:rubrerythrin